MAKIATRCPSASRFFRPLLLLLFAAVPAVAVNHAPPAQDATEIRRRRDPRDAEKVSIAAEPCNDQRDCTFFRLPYVAHSMLPIRVIITNNSDIPLTLDDVRIQFISANKDTIPAALPDDLNRRLFTRKSAQGTKIPLTPITIHHPPGDKKITDDDADFGFRSTLVEPHTTVAGYLFYDILGLEDPALKDAELYVKEIHSVDGKKQLFPFSIPFNTWLAAQKPRVADSSTSAAK